MDWTPPAGRAPGDRIGAIAGFFAHFRVFVHDDDQGRFMGGGFPDALAFAGHLPGPLVEPADSVAEQLVSLRRMLAPSSICQERRPAPSSHHAK
jgi:hypothetical protein